MTNDNETPGEEKRKADSEASGSASSCGAGTRREARSYAPPRGKLFCYDWLADIPGAKTACDIVEVQFKNTRKGFFRNSLHLPLAIGDLVAVEAAPGHDIGQVTLTGPLVVRQMKRSNLKHDAEIKRVLRKAKPSDLERFEEAKAKENDTMIRARKIAEDLKLNMKIGDVEYQGDGNKAIFYYIADERVDFRQLIKDLAAAFHVRIEMKQIGARQEAGRIGGTGPCGRELCCATWMKNFSSVSTTAARHQDISLNPTKLAGMCAKLKCCLNYEVDNYIEAGRKLPGKDVILQTLDNDYYLFKSDILSGQVTYSTAKNMAANLETISAERAHEIIAMNRQGEKPLTLTEDGKAQAEKKPIDLLADADISRFDKSKRQKKNNKNRQNNNRPRQQQARNDGNGAMENSGQHNNGDRHNGSSNNYQGSNNRRPRGRRNNDNRNRGERQSNGETKE